MIRIHPVGPGTIYRFEPIELQETAHPSRHHANYGETCS